MRRIKTPSLKKGHSFPPHLACLAILLKRYGFHATVDDFDLIGDPVHFADPYIRIVKTASAFGIEAKFMELHLEDLFKAPFPLIVGTQDGDFSILEGIHKEKVYLHHPIRGHETLSLAEWSKYFSSKAISLKLGVNFRQEYAPMTFQRLIHYTLKRFRATFIFVGILSLLLSLTGLGSVAFIHLFTNHIIQMGQFTWKYWVFIGLCFSFVLFFVICFFEQRILIKLSSRFSLLTSTQLFERLLRLPMRVYQKVTSIGFVMSTRFVLLASWNFLSNPGHGNIMGFVIMMTPVITYTLITFFFQRTFGFITLALFALMAVVAYIAMKLREPHTKANWHWYVKNRNQVGGMLLGYDSMLTHGGEHSFYQVWTPTLAQCLSENQKMVSYTNLLNSFSEFIYFAALTLLVWICGLDMMTGTFSFGRMMGLLTLMHFSFSPLSRLGILVDSIQEMQEQSYLINQFVERSVDPMVSQSEGLFFAPGVMPHKLSGRVEVKELSFGYKAEGAPLLNTISFVIEPGEKVALVGRSGSGKTTLIKLLMGLYPLWQGKILYDRYPLENIPKGVLNHSLGYCSREFSPFNDTLRNNLTFGDDTLPEAYIIKAAEDSTLHPEVLSRDGGYHDPVFEGGINLSASQLHRLDLTEALIQNPSFLLIDGSTSQLTRKTEIEIYNAFNRREMGYLWVTNSLFILENVHKVLFIEEGKILGFAPHETLKNQIPLYQYLSKDSDEYFF